MEVLIAHAARKSQATSSTWQFGIPLQMNHSIYASLFHFLTAIWVVQVVQLMLLPDSVPVLSLLPDSVTGVEKHS
jgi:hypothetical protein